ncbi:cilia- and flagella-associated protein 58-like [Uloborus diversus]|uniref:cilia- and flagella-associated protein 58-like n=1 Tax=Uloborus diversus TaxID=327109 RepID=UPI00240A70E0|nr:cilia- and flagella-associated protein 58-like [Uloborus diversus]
MYAKNGNLQEMLDKKKSDAHHLETNKRLVISLKEKEQDYIVLNKEVEYQKTYIRPLESEIERVKFQRDNSVREVLEHKQIIATLEGTIQALKMQIIEVEKKNSKLHSELESSEGKCKKLSESERDAWAECRDVKHNLEKAVYLQEIAVHRSKIQSQQIRSVHEECNQMEKQAAAVKNDMKAVKSSLKLLEDRNKELEKEIQAKEAERLEALKFKSEKEQAVDAFNMRLQSLQNDIKVLKAQMLEKGAAVATKEERINFQEKEIARLQHELDQKADVLRLLQTKLASSRRSQTIAENRVGDIEKLRKELHRLNQLLTQEKLKNKMAEEELKNPNNLHR